MDSSSAKAIIVGASSGIGAALARVLAGNGYTVGLLARRTDLLAKLCSELGEGAVWQACDVRQPGEAQAILKTMIDEMGGVDLVVLSAGIGFINPRLEWEREAETIEVNVTGFAALANVAVKHFIERGRGHLVGISSIAALGGSSGAPAYFASKAFVSNYLEGLSIKVARLANAAITVTDIKPGFVDTAMAQGAKFWVASPERAAEQIFGVIRRRGRHAYVTRRWRLMAWLIRILPWFLYRRVM
jgi:short-subunit dehydrogenase